MSTISAPPPVSPQQYAERAAAHRSALTSLEAAVQRLEGDKVSIDGDMYGHLSMQQAVRNDRARAVKGIADSKIQMAIGGLVAVGAGAAAVAWGPGVLSVLGMAGGGFAAWSAVRYQSRACDAIGKMDSMEEVVDRCITESQQKQDDLARRLQSAQADIAAHRAQLELLEVARRVSASSAPGGIVQEDQTVRIGGIMVPKATRPSEG